MNRPHAIGGSDSAKVILRAARPYNHQSGFTLVELMFVVVIIGILAAVALPSYSSYTSKAQATEAFVLVEPVQTAVRDYYARWGRFPDSNAAAGVAPPAAYRGRYVRSIEVNSGGAIRVQVELTGKYVPAFSVYFRPAMRVGSENGNISWICDEGKKDTQKEFVISGEIGKDTAQKNDVLPHACRP